MSNIQVVDIEDGDYFNSDYTSGSTVNVTLKRDGETVKCEGILIWDEVMMDDDLFDEWKFMAEEGVEGYTYTTE